MNAVLPELLRKYRNTEVVIQQKAILDVFLEFLEANKMLYGSIEDKHDGMFRLSPLGMYMCLSVL